MTCTEYPIVVGGMLTLLYGSRACHLKVKIIVQLGLGLNPITHGGVDPLRVKYISKCFMLTFPIYLFTKKISKKNRIFLRGYPPPPYQPLKK